MKMRVVWSKFAQAQLDEIFHYYLEEAGFKVAYSLIESIIKHPDYLTDNPKAGQLEELLKGRKLEYRYIIYKNYKIIYSVDTELNLLKIADVFDTRQNPRKIERNK